MKGSTIGTAESRWTRIQTFIAILAIRSSGTTGHRGHADPPASITVKNMNGDVALNGTVPSYPQYLEAAGAAQRVAGVTNVHNHLEVVLPPADYRDDAQLTTTANDALTLNITVPDGGEATARNG